jgi:hypothetical protein
MMCGLLTLFGVYWAQILQIVLGIWVAWVATAALSTWKKQLRAQKQLSFIDELTDTVHEFILLMAAPINRLVYAKIGIDAHKGIALEFEQYENAEAIAFIHKDGRGTSERIVADLALVRPVLGKMQALAVKGQVLGLKDYPKCQDACAMLAWSYDQIEAFCAIIGNPNLNWGHPLIQESLGNLSKIDADRINTNLAEQNKKFVEFATMAYANAIR